MKVEEWSQRLLIQVAAAHVCEQHGYIFATENVSAVHEAVRFARVAPFSSLSSDGAELTVLETYLSLPETCSQCDREAREGTAHGGEPSTS